MKTLIRNRFTFGLMGVIFCSVVDPVITSSAPATNGRPSAISQIAKNLNSWGTCGQAAAELAKLGPEGFAALTNGFSNKDEEIRGIIIKVIGEQAAFDSNTVARFMIGCLKDPYSLNRAYAARYLSNKDPALAIPALLPVLNDDPETNCTEILAAAGALSSYRTAARMAVPKLLTLWTNEIFGPNRKIAAYWQSGLMDALKGIDMEAAVQAETFLVNSCPMSDGRAAYTVTLLPSGKELIAGGYLRSYVPSVTNRELSKAEIYDPNSREWTETGQMNTARCGHRATLLRDGKVLIEGGFSFGAVEPPHTLASAEIYDPATGKWTATGEMNNARLNHTATLLSDGKVLVDGGSNPDVVGHFTSVSSKELYDPATGRWMIVTNSSALPMASVNVTLSPSIGSGNPGLKVATRGTNSNAIVIYQDEPETVGNGLQGGMMDRKIKVIFDRGYNFRQEDMEIPEQLYPFDSDSAFTSTGGSWDPLGRNWEYIPRGTSGFRLANGDLTTFTNVQMAAEAKYHLNSDEAFLGFIDNKVFFWRGFNPTRVFWRERDSQEVYYYIMPKQVIDIYGVTKGIQNDVCFVAFGKSTGLFSYSPYEERLVQINFSGGRIYTTEEHK